MILCGAGAALKTLVFREMWLIYFYTPMAEYMVYKNYIIQLCLLQYVEN